MTGRVRQALTHHWPYFKLAVGTFLLGVLVGSTVDPGLDSAATGGLYEEQQGTTLALFSNNATVALVMWGSWLTFGLGTFATLLFNGTVIGSLLEQMTAFTDVAWLVPHAVLEFCALCLAASTGYMVPGEFARYVVDEKEAWITYRDAINALVVIGVALAVLLLAAVVEARLTPVIASSVN